MAPRPSVAHGAAGRALIASCIGALGAAGCGGALDASRNVPHGLLPVDERNPVIIDNDGWSDNWLGEYAVLLANSGGPPLAGIIANATSDWPDANANATGWGKLVAAARASGLKNIPDVTVSSGAPLARPADGQLDSTVANHSVGARLIVELSRQLGLASRPLVVLGGAPLTNLADAYLVDHSVVDRVVVVAALGEYSAPNGTMNGPNGDLDPWADWIVAQRFRYVQVSAHYDQTGDVATADLTRLPQNALGSWMRDKQPNIFTIPNASDQIAVLSVALPTFAVAVQRASPDTSVTFDSSQGPPLRPDSAGAAWIVTQIAAPLAASRLWQMLLDPHTYGS
jgi:hypothetical protein